MKKKKPKGWRKKILLATACLVCVPAGVLIAVGKPWKTYTCINETSVDPRTQKLANTCVKVWQDSALCNEYTSRLYQQNPEWDFMFRTYSVLSFANLALRDAAQKDKYLALVDYIITDTLRKEQAHGFKYFLMGYGQGNDWKDHPARSQFTDGEIALMLAVRCMVEPHESFQKELDRRVNVMADRMRKSPVLCAESYPDESWIFCNTISLAAICIADKLNQTDHSDLTADWIQTARTQLIDPETGLMRSAFTFAGDPVSSAAGPEGSSIWMSCHMLQIVDPEFANAQYAIARDKMIGDFVGFGYSREWPRGTAGHADIDSGMIVPILGASPSASGLALVCTSAFKDWQNFGRLCHTLDTFAMPQENGDCMYYQASNALGDVVLLYGLTNGPIWDKFRNMKKTDFAAY